MYIVIEGQDGTGKSTQARLLAQYFQAQGKNAVIIDEPDGDLEIAHTLHDLILDKNNNYHLAPLTNVLLFTAARYELWQKLAEPALKNGSIIISARNWWSTLAYQGEGEGVEQTKIAQITQNIMPKQYLTPNKSIILTVPDQIRQNRQNQRGKAAETFETKNNNFQTRVNKAYLKIAETYHIPIIDASGSIEQVFDQIKAKLGV